MLEKSNGERGLPKKTIIMIASTVAVAIVLSVFYYIYDLKMNPDDVVSADNGRLTERRNTSFDGKTINPDDKDAVKQYCEDARQSSMTLSNGATIKDLCVLDSVRTNWIPFMSDDEISKMLAEQPSCFATEFDDEGFHCFTGFDKKGCNRAGVTEDGTSCARTVVSDKQPKSDPFAQTLPANLCDALSDCQTEAAFSPDGFNKYDCDRQGKNREGETCPYEYITRIYSDKNLDQLGFTPEGFNSFNCDIRGNKADGTACPIDQVTRVYNKDNVDQFGFNPKGFNRAGCSLQGLKEDGTVCLASDITLLVDPVTGLDQFGMLDGFDPATGCSLDGFTVDGQRCDLSEIKRIFGKDGIDQFGFRASNRNVFNCDIKGLKPDGSLCPDSEVTRIYSPLTGKDQFGFFSNGKNDFDCDFLGQKPDGSFCSAEQKSSRVNPVTGRDANGLDSSGYNEKSCNVQGFHRSGVRCDAKDVPRIINKETGLDQFGLNKDLRNKFDCDMSGFKSDGSICDLNEIPRVFDPITGLDQFGLNKNNKNAKGCGLDGLREDGTLCPVDDIPRIINPATGLDQFLLDSEGFSAKNGCNLAGLKKDGTRCEYDDIIKLQDSKGFNQLGLNAEKRNAFNCDLAGRKPDGSMCLESEMTTWFDEGGFSPFHKNKDGFGRLDFNDLGFNKFNCDINGKHPDGTLCEISEISHVYDPLTQLDQFGLKKDGFNEFNCSLSGLNREGEKCDLALTPRIFGDNGIDQLGNNILDTPVESWLLKGKGVYPFSPLLTSLGEPVVYDGKEVYIDEFGNLRDVATGLLVTDSEGNNISLSENGDLVTKNGVVKRGPFFESEKDSVFDALLDADGKQVLFDGKPVFVDKNGQLRDGITGELLKDSEGNFVELNGSGDLATKNGIVKKGPFLTTRASSNGLSAILDEQGNPVLFNGKSILVDQNGMVRDALTGKVLTDAKGNPILLNASGDLVTKDGVVKKGPFVAADQSVMKPLLDANGKQVMLNGKPVFVDALGNVIDAETGEPLLDALGNKVSLNSNGDLVTKDGVVKKGPFVAAAQSVMKPLLDANGKQVMLNGKPVFVDALGNVIDAETGEPLLDASGNKVSLNSNGDLVTKDGVVKKGPFVAAAQSVMKPLLDANGKQVMLNGKPVFVDALGNVIDGQTGLLLKDALGNIVSLGSDGDLVSSIGSVKDGPFTVLKSNDLKALLDENGSPVMLDGKQVFVDAAGNLRDAETGLLLTDGKGDTVRLSASGDLITKDGVIKRGPFSSSKANNLKALVGADGEPVMLNGKPVFVDANGQLIDGNTGLLLTDANGDIVSLSANGDLVSENGVIRKGPFSKLLPDDNLTGLIGPDGKDVWVNGEQVFVDGDGMLRSGKTGLLLTDGKGKLVRLNSAGDIVTSDGVIKSGPFEIPLRDIEKVTPLLSSDGTPVFYKGKQVRVNGDGNLVDANGKLILGEDGLPLSLNERGQIITSKGAVVPPSEFTSALGEPLKGNFSADTAMSETSLENLLLASKLNAADRKSLGLDDLGFNSANCGLNGLDRNGFICELKDIPRVFDPVTKLDQFGLRSDDFNVFGCGLDGKNRAGEDCPLDQVPFIYDRNQRNQFGEGESGFKASGLNSEGENAFECDVMGNGVGCTDLRITKLVDAAGVNQFNKKEGGSDRLGLVNGFNSFDCDINGLSRSGELCELSKIPRYFDENDFDQFGLNPDGYNKFNCNLEGKTPTGLRCDEDKIPRIFDKKNIDQFGLTPLKRNAKGCGLDGFNTLGARCDFEDIPKVYGDSGVDQLGFLPDGFNLKNCNISGLDRNGKVCPIEDITRVFDLATGLDQFGLTEDGFNSNNCSISGQRKGGGVCLPSEITQIFGSDGKNQLGFYETGYNDSNCDFYGYAPDGNLCKVEDMTRVFSLENVDQFGANKETGLNANDCGLDGRNQFGKICKPSLQISFKNAKGKDQFGLINGYNENECDINGIRKDGTLCSLEEVTRVFDRVTGEDQLGFNTKNVNKYGCTVNGLDANGKPCDPSKITHRYDLNNIDQFGLNSDKVNSKGCNLLGFNSLGEKCSVDDSPAIYGKNGFSQFGFTAALKDAEGYGTDGFADDDCDRNNVGRDGVRCSMYKDLELTVEDGEYMEAKKTALLAWVSSQIVAPKAIATGSYTYTAPEPVTTVSAVSATNGFSQANGVQGTPIISNSGVNPNQQNTEAKNGNGIVEIPMGLMAMVRVKSPVDSDYTTDVYAEFLGTALDGATLKGTIEVPYLDDAVMPRDKFRYVFTQLIWKRRVYPIHAISLDMSNDSGMVTADDVNYHRFQRYGGLIVASAVQALDATFLDSEEAALAKEQSSLIEQASQNGLLYGTNTLDLTKQNLQTATTHITDLAKEQFTRRPTITKGPGQHIIIFQESVDNDELPVLFSEVDY